MSSGNRNSKAKYDPMAVAQGSARKAHFAAGGDTRGWLGRSTKFADERKDASRKACRGKYRGGDE